MTAKKSDGLRFVFTPTVYKFHYYPTKGYTCSQAGDNSGYYVNLNDYDRLKDENNKLKAALIKEGKKSEPKDEPLRDDEFASWEDEPGYYG